MNARGLIRAVQAALTAALILTAAMSAAAKDDCAQATTQARQRWLAAQADQTVVKHPLTIEVGGLKSRIGSVRIGLYAPGMCFPQEGQHIEDRVVAVADDDRLSVTFEAVPTGEYALALIYDINGNGRLDYRLGMFPAEPVAFSAGAKAGAFGPPKFADAQITVDQPRKVTIVFDN